jgi:hypothetical protein
MKRMILLAMVMVFFMVTLTFGQEVKLGGFTIKSGVERQLLLEGGSHDYLSISNNLINLKVFSDGKVLKERWKTINENEEPGVVTLSSTSNVFYYSNSDITTPSPKKKSRPIIKTKIDSFDLIYDDDSSRLTVKNENFELRIYTCGMVKKFVWEELK